MAFITGTLIFVLGIVHILYGELIQIPDLRQYLEDPLIVGSTRVMIYQGGVILLAVGCVQVLKGSRRIRLSGASAYFPVGIITLNILTFLSIGLVSDHVVLTVALPQLIVFLTIILLMVLELRAGVDLEE